jgi:hypothetical protein
LQTARGGGRFGNDDDVGSTAFREGHSSIAFTNPPLDPVAHHGRPDLLAHGNPEPALRGAIRARGDVHNQGSPGDALAATLDTQEARPFA